MSMKSTSAPRRVYTRNGYIHVLYAGDIFGMKADDTKLTTKHPVKIEGNGDGSITVTQRAPKKAGVSETWNKVRVPCHSRG